MLRMIRILLNLLIILRTSQFAVGKQTRYLQLIAGTGTEGDSGENIPATSAQLDFYNGGGIWGDGNGTLFIGDGGNRKLRKITSQGIITTLIQSGLHYPEYVTGDTLGKYLYINEDTIQRYSFSSPSLTRYAGYPYNKNGHGYRGDGGPATSSILDYPMDLYLSSSGLLFIADSYNDVIRVINTTSGIITLFAGSLPSDSFGGDGGPALSSNCKLDYPHGVYADSVGNVFIADTNNYRIRKVNNMGIITTFAGGGYGKDGGLAILASISADNVFGYRLGNIYVSGQCSVRMIDVTGIISTIIGRRVCSNLLDFTFSPATSVYLGKIYDLWVDNESNIFWTEKHGLVRRTVFVFENDTTEVPTIIPTAFPTIVPSQIPTRLPSHCPTTIPTTAPSPTPSVRPTFLPSKLPTASPSTQPYFPTISPTTKPSASPSWLPSLTPSITPSNPPTVNPSIKPTSSPSHLPSIIPTKLPTKQPSQSPTMTPTRTPTANPTTFPTFVPSLDPTTIPSATPSATCLPTITPTNIATIIPTHSPSFIPSLQPSTNPSPLPTVYPSYSPSFKPSFMPSFYPTTVPTIKTVQPSRCPTVIPSFCPSVIPSRMPSKHPTGTPTVNPTVTPSSLPSYDPSLRPTRIPTTVPTRRPTAGPSRRPTKGPTEVPTKLPTKVPTTRPSQRPSFIPSLSPTFVPTDSPTSRLTTSPTLRPTSGSNETIEIEGSLMISRISSISFTSEVLDGLFTSLWSISNDAQDILIRSISLKPDDDAKSFLTSKKRRVLQSTLSKLELSFVCIYSFDSSSSLTSKSDVTARKITELESKVMQGEFQNIIKDYAMMHNIPDLLNAECHEATISSINSSEGDASSESANDSKSTSFDLVTIIAIVSSGSLIILIFLLVVYCCWLKERKRIDVMIDDNDVGSFGIYTHKDAEIYI